MNKHRKTLKEKKLADLRRKFYNGAPLSKIEPVQTSVSIKSTPAASSINKYPYLIKDTLKTSILTCAIVAAQVILFFLLKKQILVLPMAKY